MTEHTPTPWQVHDAYADTIVNGEDLEICACDNNYAAGPEKDFANAAFIVKAVNNHDALVKAVVSAQRIIERDFPNGQLAIDIKAVLAAVGGSRNG